MIDIRTSDASAPNSELQSVPRREGQSNLAWLTTLAGTEDLQGAVVLLGGTSRTAVRLRFAQSHARRDLLPSYWSHAALILENRPGRWPIAEVSLEPANGFGDVPYNNAIQRSTLRTYDDPAAWPNIACLRLRSSGAGNGAALPDLDASLRAIARQRQLADIPTALLQWLGFAWGAEGASNPLVANRGIPSAVMIEAVYAAQGIELTPGLATAASCPEAIWQAAKWWHKFYASPASRTGGPFTGWFSIGQYGAAVVESRPMYAAHQRTVKRPARRAKRSTRG